jgi:uncharacterized protein
MTFSIYQASVPRMVRQLGNLSAILTKASAHCTAHTIDPAALLQSRLFPDMFPLCKQVQIACDMAKGCGARLAGVENPKHVDTEQSFEELQARIEKVIDFLQALPESAFDGAEDRSITLKVAGGGERTTTGADYLMHFAWPNLHFHATTAYALLRHNGVPVGKGDYLGA